MDKEYNDSLLNFRARWDIVGKLAYKFERSELVRMVENGDEKASFCIITTNQ